MKSQPQIYDLKTIFNFGYDRGKSLQELIDTKRLGFVRLMIIGREPFFIPNPETINALEKLGLFGRTNDLFKRSTLKKFKKNYDDFVRDPVAYRNQERVKNQIKFYLLAESRVGDLKRQKKTWDIGKESLVDFEEFDVKKYKMDRKPIDLDATQDPSENIFLDLLAKDESDHGGTISYNKRKPIDPGSAQDPSVNPYLGIFPDDEAETSYWNTE